MSGLLLAIILTASAVSILISAHTILFTRCTQWYLDESRLVWTNRAEHDRRRANPPWFIRYFEWLERRKGARR